MNWLLLRRVLDRLYLAAGVIAALFLIAMLLLIVAQMGARWTQATFRGAPDYAGYCMASASFFAFAHALNRGAHIRVGLLLNALGERSRHWLEVWCFFVGSVASTYIAWFAIKAVRWSYKFHDISQGQDATPIWIPQLSMAIGASLLAICFWDNLVRLLFTRTHNLQTESISH